MSVNKNPNRVATSNCLICRTKMGFTSPFRPFMKNGVNGFVHIECDPKSMIERSTTNNRTGGQATYLTVIKVKLPSSSSYHSSPSGDTEFEEAYKEAIFKAKPSGFEVAWPKLNHRWPVDSEGFTYVPLYLTDAKDAIAGWQEKYDSLAAKHKALVDGIRKLL